ncbi:EAP30/Vps36 family-domain-containing protein [Pelagophyceae sp. CCMP2097]|nr:EAP30/Vps36 family-domain-containing protein [Pelagophyceae sp. CCMP2097]
MHRRRGVGVSAVRKKKDDESRFEALGKKLEAENAAHVSDFVSSFKLSLENFASKHKRKIRSDPVFRAQFTAMCLEIGVDPLRSAKGLWGEVMGVGEFFYELGVKIIGVCVATREANGGLIGLDELLLELNASGDSVTGDDVKRAVAKLKVLGSGFAMVGDAVLSVPMELNGDQTLALDAAKGTGVLGAAALAQKSSGDRANAVVDDLLKRSFVWVDSQADPEPLFFFPSLWLDAQLRREAPES